MRRQEAPRDVDALLLAAGEGHGRERPQPAPHDWLFPASTASLTSPCTCSVKLFDRSRVSIMGARLSCVIAAAPTTPAIGYRAHADRRALDRLGRFRRCGHPALP